MRIHENSVAETQKFCNKWNILFSLGKVRNFQLLIIFKNKFDKFNNAINKCEE